MNIVKLLTDANYPVRELTQEELTQLKSVFVEIFKDIYSACQKHHLQVWKKFKAHTQTARMESL